MKPMSDWCDVQLSCLDLGRPRHPGRQHLNDVTWSDDGEMAYRVAVVCEGRHELVPVKFARRQDAMAAADALQGQFSNALELARARDSVIRRVMVEAMQW